LTTLSSAGVLPASSTWWSGSGSNGRFNGLGCDGFNYLGGTGATPVGASTLTNGAWIFLNSPACAQTNFILCIAF
jgi:hypothetical protein